MKRNSLLGWQTHVLVGAGVVLLATARTGVAEITASTRNAMMRSNPSGTQSQNVFEALQAVVTQPDTDQDGTPDWADNCQSSANPDQADADSDGVGDGCDNCAADFNPAQTDSSHDGVGDLCQRTVPASTFTVTKVQVRANNAQIPKPRNGRILVRGVLDPTQLSAPLADVLRQGMMVGVSGAGLSGVDTMVFFGTRCLQLTKARIQCFGTFGEEANFRLQRRAPHHYNVDITAKYRSIAMPLTPAPGRVVFSNGGIDRRADVINCRNYGKRFVFCRE